MPARLCEVCGERIALYLCQDCGAAICPQCRRAWTCERCSAKTAQQDQETADIAPFGTSLLFPVAMAIIFLGFALVALGSLGAGNSGGCFVWPFPIIVSCGLGSGTGTTSVLSAVAFVGFFAFVVFLFWRFARPRAVWP